jgi:hypothetical protein
MSRFGTLIIALVIAGSATPAPALAQPQDFSALRQRLASEVWVYRDAAPIHGYLTRLTPHELTLVDDQDQEQVVSFESISRIERSGDRIWNGFAIGAAIGLVEGVFLSGELNGPVSEKFQFTLAAAGVYGLIGAGIDAMHVGTTTIYKAPPCKKEGLSITPSRDGRGAMVGWNVGF